MARFNFLVDDDTALDSLVKVTNRSSKADVVRDALSLYKYLADRIVEGDRIFLGKDPSTIRELAVTTLQRLSQTGAIAESR
jgi:hypothetical protein